MGALVDAAHGQNRGVAVGGPVEGKNDLGPVRDGPCCICNSGPRARWQPGVLEEVDALAAVFDVMPAKLLPNIVEPIEEPEQLAFFYKTKEQAEALRKWLASSLVIAEMMRDQLPSEESDMAALVFVSTSGRPLRRTRFSDVWRAAAASAGLGDGVTFHDLRHYASLLIRHGESVKVVQKRLGDKAAVETLDTHSHLWPDSEDRTRDAVDEVLGRAAGGPSVGVAP
jgi:hypothetical protein